MKKNKIVDRRIFWTEIFVVTIFLVLAITLTRTIYFKRSFYEEKLASLTEVIIEGESAPRGRIYDRNYKLLVDNVSVPVIYYQKKDDISVEEEKLGLKGSPTRVWKSFTKGAKAAGKVFEVEPAEAADIIVEKLKEKFII